MGLWTKGEHRLSYGSEASRQKQSLIDMPNPLTGYKQHYEYVRILLHNHDSIADQVKLRGEPLVC